MQIKTRRTRVITLQFPLHFLPRSPLRKRLIFQPFAAAPFVRALY
jgi:hypothetical protein